MALADFALDKLPAASNEVPFGRLESTEAATGKWAKIWTLNWLQEPQTVPSIIRPIEFSDRFLAGVENGVVRKRTNQANILVLKGNYS